MVFRFRYLLAAVLGVCLAPLSPGQEPGRLSLDRGAALPAGPAPADQALANAVARQLKQSGHLHNYRLDLACRGSVVEICGVVTDQSQADEALRLVQGTPGVERVVNRLMVAQNDRLVLAQADKPPVVPPPQLPEPGESEKKPAAAPTEPMPLHMGGPANPQFDLNPPKMPPFAWPTYSPYPNFSRVAYPEAYPYNAWPFIGPVYPFPKVPLGWRAVKLEFEDGYWWFSRTATKHDWWRLRFW